MHRLGGVTAGGGLVVDAGGDRAERGATVVAQLAEGGAVAAAGVVVDAAAAAEPVGEPDDAAEFAASDALAALWVVAAAEPQPASATAKTARRSRPGCRFLVASWAIPRASRTPHRLGPRG